MAGLLSVTPAEISAALTALDELDGVVEKLTFLPASVKTVLADLQKGLEFAQKVVSEV
jgi:hypothetical protein